MVADLQIETVLKGDAVVRLHRLDIVRTHRQGLPEQVLTPSSGRSEAAKAAIDCEYDFVAVFEMSPSPRNRLDPYECEMLHNDSQYIEIEPCDRTDLISELQQGWGLIENSELAKIAMMWRCLLRIWQLEGSRLLMAWSTEWKQVGKRAEEEQVVLEKNQN